MKRKIIVINEALCSGCGLCAGACHEGAIGIVNGKAALMRDVYCDGLGACLPACPEGALSIEEREAPAFDAMAGRLAHWPIQLKLASPAAPFFANADILLSADCAAYAYGNFHNDYMKGRVTLIGCPKLDGVDYSEKIGAILAGGTRSLTIARMEVPCCGGLVWMAKNALKQAENAPPARVITFSTEGAVIGEEAL